MRAEDCARFDAHVIGDADLAADDDVVFNDGAARKAGLGGNDHVLADLHIVADMHQIVDFRAAADARLVERAAVDGGVGADFDVVLNDEASNLWELFVASGLGVADVAESFAAQYRSSLDDDTVAKARAGIDGHIGVDAAVNSDLDAVANHATRADCGSFADFAVLSDDCTRANRDILADFGGAGDDGGSVDGS